MRLSFYPRIALTGIRNNKRLYYPFFLTCITVVAMFYIMCYITFSKTISNVKAGNNLQMITGLGIFVIGLFAILFVLYTNSFLTKRRMKEFGLYNVLGMSKKNIAIVLFYETVYAMAISIALGLAVGILFSKLSELLLINIIKMEISMDFSISGEGIRYTLFLFAVVFIILYVNNIVKITSSRTIELVKAMEEGEKAPRANWVLGILGLAILVIAYYMAISVDNAFGALTLFFVAVLLVIIATYILFISGSVVLCRILQKNKSYYYRTDHFISTSTMSFRMKRNGAGLATICILSTMVLVMISSSASLYYGADDAINGRFQNEIETETRFSDVENLREDNIIKIDETIESVLRENDIHVSNVKRYRATPAAGYVKGNSFTIANGATSDFLMSASNILLLNVVPLEDYNALTGKDISLESGEALCYSYNVRYGYDTIIINDAMEYRLIMMDDDFAQGMDASMGISNTICLVVGDFMEASGRMLSILDSGMVKSSYCYCFDTEEDDASDIALCSPLSDALLGSDVERDVIYLNSKAEQKNDFYVTYGGLFFLGSVLSVVFIFATVLIIYYKQISEGYEDQERFAIMRKVGMTSEDIRKTISSQMLTVFYLPLVFAILHLCFAFPMIRYMLQLFQLTNIRPLLIATGLCVLLYALVYAIIYRITTNSYYSIVSSSVDYRE